MDYRLPLYLFFSLPYKEISQWEQVSSLVYSLHACPIQPGSVLKLDRLARWKRGSVPPARSYIPSSPRLLYPPATISAIKAISFEEEEEAVSFEEEEAAVWFDEEEAGY
ncbi:unnamed protein product [Brassica napus]|uniref:(rape) hypothetical protein n=1 Tax=Brassica napus TaxID=3708 RepID=A0A816ME78_BRANA|nr:unnamed protein product [Brassica napus]